MRIFFAPCFGQLLHRHFLSQFPAGKIFQNRTCHLLREANPVSPIIGCSRCWWFGFRRAQRQAGRAQDSEGGGGFKKIAAIFHGLNLSLVCGRTTTGCETVLSVSICVYPW